MAMVNAHKGDVRVRIPKSVYEKQFRKLGYILDSVDGAKQEKEKTLAHEEEETDKKVVDSEAVEEDDLETIPISEMNKEQLAEYAERHGIDTSGCRKVREARQLIQRMRIEAQEIEG